MSSKPKIDPKILVSRSTRYTRIFAVGIGRLYVMTQIVNICNPGLGGAQGFLQVAGCPMGELQRDGGLNAAENIPDRDGLHGLLGIIDCSGQVTLHLGVVGPGAG